MSVNVRYDILNFEFISVFRINYAILMNDYIKPLVYYFTTKVTYFASHKVHTKVNSTIFCTNVFSLLQQVN